MIDFSQIFGSIIFLGAFFITAMLANIAEDRKAKRREQQHKAIQQAKLRKQAEIELLNKRIAQNQAISSNFNR